MSASSVETVRRAVALWNDGDLDGLLAIAHPDFEFVSAVAASDAVVLTGRVWAIGRGSGLEINEALTFLDREPALSAARQEERP